MRKPLSILLAVAALSFLGACGTSGGDDDAAQDATTTTAPEETTTTTEAGDGAIEVAAWAESLCSSFDTWLQQIDAASTQVGQDITPGDMEGAKTAIAGLFGSASDATQTLMADIEDGGYPDIDDGDQLARDLIEKFQGFDDAAQDAKREAEALATDDVRAFQTDAAELTDRFQAEVETVASSFSEIDTKYPSPELSEELQTACDF